jgi:hypothetical protein
MSHPAAPASTIVTTISPFLFGGLTRPVASHALGDFEDEPAQGGEAETPEKHHGNHRLDSYFYRMIANLLRACK